MAVESPCSVTYVQSTIICYQNLNTPYTHTTNVYAVADHVDCAYEPKERTSMKLSKCVPAVNELLELTWQDIQSTCTANQGK